MNEEELKEEFKRYLINASDYYTTKEPLTDRKLLQIWLDCAEPREKKILELTKENEELRLKWLQATDEGTSWAHLKSLEKENEELKVQIEKMKCCCNCTHFKECDNLDSWELVK